MTLKVNHFAHGVLLGDYLRTALDVLRTFHPNDGLLGNQESKHAPPAGGAEPNGGERRKDSPNHDPAAHAFRFAEDCLTNNIGLVPWRW
jgi:hypothetical protein